MKKALIPLIIGLISIPIIISNNFNNKPSENKNITETQATYYVLKDYKGRIALFINENKIPKETYEVFTNTLPTEDAEKIKSGIIITTERELQKILEDFIS